MSWTISAKYKDPDYANVSLLLHGNGTNGSTTITDNSPSPKTVTAVGNTQISTAQSKFGSGSILFNSTAQQNGTDRLEVASSSDFNFGANDFTIELWYYPLTRSDYSSIINRDGADFPWTLYHGTSVNSGNPSIKFGSLTAWFSADLSFGSIANNQWHHLAVTRSSGTFRSFTNGSLITTDSSWSGAIADSSGSLTVASNGTFTLRANIDDLRITKGVARYTANFTPPAAPFPDI
jgi:hypothetical protein